MTFSFVGRKFILCSRCTGFYCGVALSIILLTQRDVILLILRNGWVTSLTLALVLSLTTPIQGAFNRHFKIKGHKVERFLVGLASGISPIFYVSALVGLATS